MAILKADGTVYTQTAFLVDSPAVAGPTMFTVAQDIFETYTPTGAKPAFKKGRRLKYRAGTVLNQAQVNDLFLEPTITTNTPAVMALAGGGVVTVTGTNLGDVTGVTVSGTAGTVVTVINDNQITFVAPARTAGTYNIAVTTGAGTATRANAIVYS